jgi:RHS repeat-associated protein
VGTEAVTSYLVDSNRDYAQVVAESKGGTIGVSYVYGNDLISQKRGNAESFYLVDGLGSTRGLTNAAGGLTDSYTYDAFGNLVSSAGSTQNSYLFAGEQYDSNLDQYYLRQRFYDAGTGRFTRKDTFEGDVNSPISLHKYLYGNGNPVKYTDPSGLYSFAEANAAISISNILDSIQLDLGSRFIATASGDEEASEPDGLVRDTLFNIFFSVAGNGVEGAFALASLAAGLFPDDYELDRDARRIADRYLNEVAKNERTVAVGRVTDTGQKVVAISIGDFTWKAQRELEAEGYIVLREKRGSGPHNHAEKRLIQWQYSSEGGRIAGRRIEAIGASRPICPSCWAIMQMEGIRRGSPLGKTKPRKK